MDKKNNKGITLIELLVALVIGGIIIAGIYRVFVSQGKAYVIQDQVAETQQNIRSAMEIMVRDLRMAGYNGDNTPSDPYINPGQDNITIFYLKEGALQQINYSTVLGEDGVTELRRNGETILRYVNRLEFNYGIDTDIPPDGTVNRWVSAGDVGTSRVIAVQVTLTANPEQESPQDDRFKAVSPRTLQSTVTLRNLCLR